MDGHAPAEVANAFLGAFTTGDLDTAYALIADDFVFHGPMLQAEGRAAFIEGSQAFGPMGRGHRVLHQWVDGDDVCTIYEYLLETPAGAGAFTLSEWHTVRDGKLVRTRLLFDTAELVALMPS